jgi:protocatechuate 3,4-dioxygenase, beta subunit
VALLTVEGRIRDNMTVDFSMLARRKLIFSSLALAGASSLLRLPASAAGTLPPTPRQTPGPFYPLSLPQDADNDLVHVSGHQGTAQGRITKITGRILDLNGRPVPGARVEIWQCDANGLYHYVRDNRGDQTRDENFQGYGATVTNRSGGYQFLTIKPVSYPGRTPHIHFAVSQSGFERFITQMYVAGEARNESDPVLMGVRDPAARARLMVAFRPSSDLDPDGLSGVFDIVLDRLHG